MQAVAGRRMKRKLQEDMNKEFRKQMHKSYENCDGNDSTYDKATQEGESLIKKKYPTKKQTSYSDIPVFPYGYNRKRPFPSWGDRDLKEDYLPSDATRRRFHNLYLQLGQHSLSLASLVLPTTVPIFGPTRPLKYVAATPSSPPMIFRPVDGPQPMEEDVSTNSGGTKKMTSRENRREKLKAKCAGPDSKKPSKAPLKGKAILEEKPDQDCYHIIRILSSSGKYLELLRQDSDGYIIGWRVLSSLDDFETAYWCLFKDFDYLEKELSFLEIRITSYDSGYGSLEKIYYGQGTLDIIIDDFLDHLYEHPEEDQESTGETYFFILCMLFGEGPRLEAIRRFIYSSMEYTHYECETDHPLGSVRFDLMQKWSYGCDTTFYLSLVEFEKIIIKEELVKNGGINRPGFQPFLEQHHLNRRQAHTRCEYLMSHFNSIFHLLKEEQDEQDQYLHLQELDEDRPLGKYHMYGVGALHQLLNQELHLLKHNHELVSSIILRRGNFSKKIVIPRLVNVGKPIGTPDVMFWELFDCFDTMDTSSKVSPINVMKFLDNARPFLFEHDFPHFHQEIYDDIMVKCEHFEKLLWNGRVSVSEPSLPWSVDDAAHSAWIRGGEWLNSGIDRILLIVEFLRDFKPNAEAGQAGQAGGPI